MTRKHCKRRAVVPLPRRWLRPKLAHTQLRDLAMVHLVNLDAITRETADEATLWEWVGGVLTWSRVADLLQVGVPEMHQQLELAARLIQRFGQCGQVRFDGPDYSVARAGAVVMDELAATVDRHTAIAAADWSERRLAVLRAHGTRPESMALNQRTTAGAPDLAASGFTQSNGWTE